jgi:hypothetical protein
MVADVLRGLQRTPPRQVNACAASSRAAVATGAPPPAGQNAAMQPPPDAPAGLGQPPRPHWQRVLWVAAGTLALATGLVGIVLPLLPTTPFVLLAAFCFSRGSARLEAWLLAHPRFGPAIAGWRRHRVIPLAAKRLAWVMMAVGSAWAAWVMPLRWAWLPAVCCLLVGLWMWRLPSVAPVAPAGPPPG